MTLRDAVGNTPLTSEFTFGTLAYAQDTWSGETGFPVTGNVTYNLYAGSGCSGSLVQTSTVAISAGSSSSANTGALAVGTFLATAVDYTPTWVNRSNFHITLATPTDNPAQVPRAGIPEESR